MVDKWIQKAVDDKQPNNRPPKAKGKIIKGSERAPEKGEKRGRKEEKTTATELCRGFNQPNYSLITGTQNLEQLTHTHTNAHSHIHTCATARSFTPVTVFHRRDGRVAMSDRLL